MKKRDALQVGEIITQLLQKENLDRTFDEQQAVALWPELVGPGINRYTIERHVSAGVLYVKLSSAPLRNELMMNRSIIANRLNELVGREVIKEIVFR